MFLYVFIKKHMFLYVFIKNICFYKKSICGPFGTYTCSRRATFCTRSVGQSFWAIDPKSWSLVVSIMRNRIKKVSERSEHYERRACATHVQDFSQTYKGAVGRSFWSIDLKSWSLVVSILRNRIQKVSESLNITAQR